MDLLLATWRVTIQEFKELRWYQRWFKTAAYREVVKIISGLHHRIAERSNELTHDQAVEAFLLAADSLVIQTLGVCP